MTMTIDANSIRRQSGSNAITLGKNSTVSIPKRLGYSSSSPAYSSVDIKRNDPNAVTGWYWLNLGGTVNSYYIDMDYDGGGWVLVGSHVINVGVPAVTWAAGVTSHTHTGSSGFTRGSSNPHSYSRKYQ